MIAATLKAVLRYSAFTILPLGLLSCVLSKSSKKENEKHISNSITLIPSSETFDLDQSGLLIENYIISIPVSPHIKSFFEDLVLHARENYPKENINDSEKLFIGGDGSRGVITFWIDRSDQSLRVLEVDETRIPAIKNQYYLYRISEGWLQTEKRLPLAERMCSSYRITKYWEGVGG